MEKEEIEKISNNKTVIESVLSILIIRKYWFYDFLLLGKIHQEAK